MPRRIKQAKLLRRALGAVALGLIWLGGVELTAATASQTSAVQQGVLSLQPQQPVEREIAKDESHVYEIALAAGQFLHLEVEQLGADVRSTFDGPDGQRLLEKLSWAQGAEPRWWIAATDGGYRLTVRLHESEKAARGRYRVHIIELRPATPGDSELVAAAHTLCIAEELRSTDKAETQKEAIKLFEQALPRWRALGQPRFAARTLFGLLASYSALSDYQKAIEYGQQAVPLWRATGDRVFLASTLMLLGEAFYYFGEYPQALDCYQQAQPLFEQLADLNGVGWVFNNIGLLHNARGEKQAALASFQKGLRVYQAADAPHGQALELTRLGALYASLDELGKAREALLQALAAWQRQNRKDPREDPRQARTLHYLGDVSAASGERTAYYNQALQRWRATGDRHWESITLHSLGRASTAAGEPQQALAYFQQALALRRDINDRRGQAATLTHLGALHHSLGERPQALNYYHEALTLRRELADREGIADTLYYLARAARDRHAPHEARAHIEEALQLVEQVRANFLNPELRASYLATVRDYYEFYVDLLMQLDERRAPGEEREDFAAQALQVSERARARSLLELLAEAGADIRQGVDTQLLARERELQERLNAKAAYQTRLRSGQPTPAQRAAAAQAVAELQAEYQQLAAQLRATSPRYAALTQPQPLKPAEMQQLLDGDTLLLEYALGAERSYLWAVTATAITGYRLPKRAEIEAAAQHVYQLLTARAQHKDVKPAERRRALIAQADAQYPEAAARLSQILLGPVAAQLGDKRLLIVGEGVLNYIPFAALPAPAGRSKPQALLIAAHEFVYLPSASVLAVLRRETAGRAPAPKTLAVLADPVFSEQDERMSKLPAVGERSTRPSTNQRALSRAWEDVSGSDASTRLERLSGSGQEADAITARVPAAQQLKALGFAANRALATDPVLSQYRILHFATHGLINNDHPDLSGLVLSLVNEQGRAQDGFLRAHEIFNLKLPAELVVLSACRTALGKEVKGEGVISLARSFMYAGAPRVVVSLWAVRDVETTDLMRQFYRHLLGAKRMSPAAALRAALAELWRKGLPPYYWAAFVLQGEYR